MSSFRTSKPAGKSLRQACTLIVRPSLLRFCVAAFLSASIALYAADSKAPETFRQYCIACHGEAAPGGINLQQLLADPAYGDNFKKWQKIASEIEHARMPPEGMPAPSDEQRDEAASWVRGELDAYAQAHAGDPGQVTVRRLTSAEYAYTIHDLTGIDLNVDRSFAGDAVGGEGFTNFGDVQFMQDAGLESYLEAAKIVADHAVVGAGPLSFFQDPGMSGFELSAIHRIDDIYRKYGFRAVAAEGGRAFGLERYGRAFYAAWEYAHRDALGKSDATLNDFAKAEDVSPRFLAHVWSVLEDSASTYPTTEVLSRFHNLPAPDAPESEVRAKCVEIQEFVINWPRWLFGAGELAAGGAGDERALVITDASLEAKTKESMRFVQRIKNKGRAGVHISAAPTDPTSTTSAVVIWRDPKVRVGRDSEAESIKAYLDEATLAKINFGHMPDGGELPDTDFAMTSGTTLAFDLTIPEDSKFISMDMDVELAPDQPQDSVLRVLVSEDESESGRPSWVLLGYSDSDAFQAWKTKVLDYAARFPQTSQGEATPSDRDPIPQPFSNEYNQPERDRFHQRVKYYRQDDFLVEYMLDDATRVKLEDAWADVKTSFEYHDAFLRFVDDKYELGLGDKGIEDLSEAEIAALPEEPRQYVQQLHDDYAADWARRRAAEPRQLDDAMKFASRAWRRPLSEREQEDLRAFYQRSREKFELDHTGAMRALIARILVSPDFLYRVEKPKEVSGITPLTDWELASRLSYFLWSSIPDQELRRAAAAGELNEPALLAKQVKRMLADPKARRLSTEFFGQWLGFYRFDQHRGVDAQRFPEFTDEVKSAMYNEAISFFEHIIRKNRPIDEIISADYTFLNKPLANLYGIDKDIESTGEVEIVKGANEFHRGGITRLGAVLTATSAPMRTSPVKRGDWMLRRVLGTPTPPPPANVPKIAADDKAFGARTIREELQAHQRNATCASCHSRIDPLGFPLEHYDAIGRWRPQYENGADIDDVAALKDGTEINGINGLIDYLESNEKQVLGNMSYKLVGYALGRTVMASDLPLIDKLAKSGGDATFADLTIGIVTSDQFRNRRGMQDLQPPAREATGAGE